MINRILILEDNDERINQFRSNLIGFHVVIVKEASEAIDLLKNDIWDVLFLDHDLGGQIYVSSEEKNTGAEVARWLRDHMDCKPRIVFIHSLNVNGQKYIKSILKDSVVFPFAWVQLTSLNLIEDNVPMLQQLAIEQTMQLET